MSDVSGTVVLGEPVQPEVPVEPNDDERVCDELLLPYWPGTLSRLLEE